MGQISIKIFKPLELIFQNLDSRYLYPDNIKNYLTFDIKFKPNKIQQIEEELNCRIVDKSEFEEFKKWKDEQNKKDQKKSTEDDFWTSDIITPPIKYSNIML